MDLNLLLAVVYFALLGTGLGSLTGLSPGVHVNTLALVLVSSAPVLLPAFGEVAALLGAEREVGPLLLVVVIVSAAVAHSFLDFLPSIFLGAPDEDTALSALPGHRLLLEGRGLDAVMTSVYGSLVGATVAVAMSVPLYFVLGPPLNLFSFLDQVTPVLVVGALAMLVLAEKGDQVTVAVRVLRASRSLEVVSLVRPVPVDGSKVTLVGRAERSSPRRGWMRTSTGRWRLKGRVPVGTVRIEGVWRVRRSGRRERLTAAALILVSGLLGLTCTEARLPLSGTWEGLGQTLLFPLLTGLFGVPTLLSSLRSRPLPEQQEPSGDQGDLLSGLRGALSGGLVGWFPGISSTTGVIIGSAFSRREGGPEAASRRFLTMVSAVGTSSTVLGLLALIIAFKGRSGAMMAVKEVLGPDGASTLALPSPWFALLLLAVLVSAAVSSFLTLRLGRWIARRAAGADLSSVNKVVLALIIGLVTVFCGLPGLVVLTVATLLGLLPPRLGVSRVHLTGCLLLPTALYFLGLKEAALAAL